MEVLLVLCVVSVAFTGLTKGAGVLPDGPLNAAVGGTVMFTTTLAPPEKTFVSVAWNFGDRNIITFAGSNVTAPEYEDRITLFLSTGSLQLRNLSRNDSGEYTVSIIPSGEAQKIGSTKLDVHERISGASVKASVNLPIEGNSVNLSCEAAGSFLNRTWMKDGSDLILADNIVLQDNNRVLLFRPLKKTDSGQYSCNISNPVSSEAANYNMVVNYGPENLQITGPSEISVGQTLTLTCSAESTPSARYTWTRNGTEIHNSSVFTKDNVEFSDSGNYTCQAMNNVTQRASSAVHGLSVTAIPNKTLICSTGCIVGSVMACLVVCMVAAAVGGYYICRNRPTKNTGAEGQNNTAFSGSQELNYADLRSFQSKDGETVQMEPQDYSSEYAQVKVNNSQPAPSSPPTYDDHMRRMRSAAQPGANDAHISAYDRK